MSANTIHTILRGALALGLCSGLLISAPAADPAPPPQKTDLGGPDRALTHVSTDKPVYRAGEKVYVRGVLLNARTHAPLPANANAGVSVEIVGPKGDLVAAGAANVQDSVAGFAWEVPEGQPGGQYTVKLTPWTGDAAGERKFDVRAYRAPRLKSQIVFVRDGYGPGDTANATLHVERAEGGIPAGAKVTATARVDGAEVYSGAATVDPAGNVSVQFNLPDTIERGEGTLSLAIEDGGVVETAAKTIPILLQTVDLGIYPEGGDLVAGLPARMYVEGRTPAQKPADIVAAVVDARGKEVAAFRTEHEGRGRVEFTPAKGQKYALKIKEPAGISKTFDLPAVKDAGTTIRAAADVVEKGGDVKLSVASTTDRKVKVTLSRKDEEITSATRVLQAGKVAEFTMTPGPEVDGVLIATVWDEKGMPLAERLVFRKPANSVNVKVTADQSTYVPGGRVSITVETTDEQGKPIPATVGLTVTDDSVLEMIEKREQSPRLPVMVLLENDVRELADAHVYLDAANPKAALATDLLLGTQGWRRFAMVDPAKFLSAGHGDAATRVLALRLPPVPRENEEFDNFAVRFGAAPGADRLAELAVEAAPPAPEPAAAVPADEPANAAAAENGEVPLGEVDADVRGAADDGVDEAKQQAADQAPGAPPVEREEIARLRQARAAGGLRAADLADAIGLKKEAYRARDDMVAVRVFAHAARPGRKEGERFDFTETLYWNAALTTDKATGQATVTFVLNDAVSSFRVFADAFDAAGALGSGTAVVESVQPFYVEPKLPLEVTVGDVVKLPVAAVSGVTGDIDAVTITATAGKGVTLSAIEPFKLGAKARERRIIEMLIGSEAVGLSDFSLSAAAGPFSDAQVRKLSVKPTGFPAQFAQGGLLGPDDGKVVHEIVIPDNLVAGSVTSVLAVYPTPLANMTEALQALIQQPSGCFEQTSSTCYPLVMAQQYFMTHTGVDPKLIEQAKANLDAGYARLASYECPQKGYEWFGGDPGHEALTAYGLMEFTDMAQVREVDPAMLERTRKWLMDRRDGKGGFSRNERALDSFGGAPPNTTNAYVVWALLEAGQKGLEKEIDTVKELGVTTDDSYIVALSANVASLAGDKAAAKKLMEKLAKSQDDTGMVKGAVTSITRSGGEALNLEATSLAAVAWMRDPSFAGNVERAMKFLADSCKAGRFGSTQSTILALRAIVTYDKMRATPKAPGTVQVVVDGKPMGGPVPFAVDTQGAIKLADVAEMMSPGKHTIELHMTGGSSMPYSVAVNYHQTKPATSAQAKVKIATKLNDAKVQEGAVTEADVTVHNDSKDGAPTPVAIVGIPGGLEVRHDQLKELVKSGKCDAYEVLGREVVLYWRELKPGQKVRLPVSLVAAVPGTYTAPASRVYLYYTDEHKHWVDGMRVTITPRNEVARATEK